MKPQHLLPMRKRKELVLMQIWWTNTISPNVLNHWWRSTKKSQLTTEKESPNRRKRRKKDLKEQKEEEWVGKHPWKPWDREKDLTAGRQNVNLDSENMVKGLSSRFSGGNVQRNLL
ncbi:hypothetical protein IFM89_020108 [Coptis chinensis]|uniref:DUF3752 domain-containing protein n=1 Tax=Coptis chinensis TaxID=261450 RepID=A0A835HE28_9MAGN|nr:hypothetical protein IFM89_020108 [Coptis chinensis]